MKNRHLLSNDLATLITKLANSQPYRSSTFIGRKQQATERVANWMLAIACGLFLSVVPLAVYYHFWSPEAQWIKLLALFIAVGVQVLSLLFVIVRSIGALLLAIQWKKITLTILLREVEVDENHALSVAMFGEDVRRRAEQHLQLKLSRLEKRASTILGNKTAALSLIGLTIPIVKEAGGLSLIHRIIDSSHNLTNWELLFLYFFTFLFGISLGAIGLKMLAERIRYQLEILSLAHGKHPAVESR